MLWNQVWEDISYVALLKRMESESDDLCFFYLFCIRTDVILLILYVSKARKLKI